MISAPPPPSTSAPDPSSARASTSGTANAPGTSAPRASGTETLEARAASQLPADSASLEASSPPEDEEPQLRLTPGWVFVGAAAVVFGIAMGFIMSSVWLVR
jgi:hypothetical protein